MKEYLQTFKEYWSFVLIGIYSVAYLYNYIYFSCFNINVFQYITFNDLLFFSIEQIMFIVICILFLEIISIGISRIIFYFLIEKKLLNRIRNKRQERDLIFNKEYAKKIIKRLERKVGYAYINIITLFLAIIAPILSLIEGVSVEASTISIAAFTFFIIKFMLYLMDKPSFTQQFQITSFFTLYIFLVGMLGMQAFFNSDKVINENYSKYNLSFNYLGKPYKVDDKLRFVGETTTYIFLYNKTDESTLIFPKTKVDNLKINAKDSFLFNRVKNDK